MSTIRQDDKFFIFMVSIFAIVFILILFTMSLQKNKHSNIDKNNDEDMIDWYLNPANPVSPMSPFRNAGGY